MTDESGRTPAAADGRTFRMNVTQWEDAFSCPGGVLTRCPANLYTWWRLGIFSVWLAAVSWSLVDQAVSAGMANFYHWWTELTHWGAIIELVYFGFAAYSTHRARAQVLAGGPVVEKADAPAPWFVCAAWCLSAVVPTLSFVICTLYWALVHVHGSVVRPLTVIMHGGNLAMALLDVLSNRQPCKLAHIHAPMLVGFCYGTFTLVYYLAGGLDEDNKERYIYPVLDWSKPGRTAALTGSVALFVVPAAYGLFFFVVSCRERCQAPFSAKSEDGESVCNKI